MILGLSLLVWTLLLHGLVWRQPRLLEKVPLLDFATTFMTLIGAVAVYYSVWVKQHCWNGVEPGFYGVLFLVSGVILVTWNLAKRGKQISQRREAWFPGAVSSCLAQALHYVDLSSVGLFLIPVPVLYALIFSSPSLLFEPRHQRQLVGLVCVVGGLGFMAVLTRSLEPLVQGGGEGIPSIQLLGLTISVLGAIVLAGLFPFHLWTIGLFAPRRGLVFYSALVFVPLLLLAYWQSLGSHAQIEGLNTQWMYIVSGVGGLSLMFSAILAGAIGRHGSWWHALVIHQMGLVLLCSAMGVTWSGWDAGWWHLIWVFPGIVILGLLEMSRSDRMSGDYRWRKVVEVVTAVTVAGFPPFAPLITRVLLISSIEQKFGDAVMAVFVIIEILFSLMIIRWPVKTALRMLRSAEGFPDPSSRWIPVIGFIGLLGLLGCILAVGGMR